MYVQRYMYVEVDHIQYVCISTLYIGEIRTYIMWDMIVLYTVCMCVSHMYVGYCIVLPTTYFVTHCLEVWPRGWCQHAHSEHTFLIREHL